MILSKTPVRICFGGGGTDVEPYSSEFGGYVLNVTINNFFRSVLNKRSDKKIIIFSNDTFTAYKFETIEDLNIPEQKFDLIKSIIYHLQPECGMDIYTHGEPLRKAGLGASASLSTSLIAGILKIDGNLADPIDLNAIAEKAFEVEDKILKNAGGRQDQYASVYGGLNGITFSGGSNVKIERLKISNSFKKMLESNLILFYTGAPHVSGDLVKEQIKSYLEKREESKNSLDILKDVAYRLRDSIISEDFEAFGKLLTEDWKEKAKFNPLITTDYMLELHKLVMKNGGIGGRINGAGGGGCLVWLVSPENKEKILSLLGNKTGTNIDFKFVDNGLKISEI
jgi:D-glycero-alpha-D-manno-heptose-7-phosphate kinase